MHVLRVTRGILTETTPRRRTKRATTTNSLEKKRKRTATQLLAAGNQCQQSCCSSSSSFSRTLAVRFDRWTRKNLTLLLLPENDSRFVEWLPWFVLFTHLQFICLEMCPTTTTTTTDSRARRTKRDFLMLLCRSGRRCNADFLPPWNIDKFDDGCRTEIFRFIFKLSVVCARFLLPLVSSGCHKKEPHTAHRLYTATAWTSFRSLLPGTIPVNHITQQKGWPFVCYCELLYVSSCHSPSYYFILFLFFLGGGIKIRDRYRKRKGNYILQLRTVWAGDCQGYVQDRGGIWFVFL